MDSQNDSDIVKMSKSDPDSAIFIFDSEDTIRKKISRAYCPVAEIKGNPVLDIIKHIIFPYYGKDFVIDRPREKGGEIIPHDYDELEIEFMQRRIHPADLKAATGEALIGLLLPARKLYEKLEGDLAELGYASSKDS